MLTVYWISIFCFLRSASALSHHTRHERTRYVSGRNQIYGFDHSQNYIPFVHYWERPLQILESSMNVPKKLSSRPLFSWDLPAPMSTYTPTKLRLIKTTTTTTTTTEDTNQSLRDAPSSKDAKSEDSGKDFNLVKRIPKSDQKTRSDRFHRAKDSTLYHSSYAYNTKNKSSNRKKSIVESNKIIKWRQADDQKTDIYEREPKLLKRKKKGKKIKKGKVDKQNEKKSRFTTEKIIPELNDGVNDINPKKAVEYLKHGVSISKVLKEKQRLEQIKKETTAPPIRSPCETMENKCDHLCKEENGQAVCVCFRGFRAVGNRCLDINECEINNGGCNGKCINTIGSRKCICSSGFRLVNGACADVNECLLRNGHGPCQDQCTNTLGSYTCSCEGLPGTILSEDKHTCEENNKCSSVSAGCSHSCINVSTRTFCTCPDGMELGEDWKTCLDIDECSNPEDYDVECPLSCINTIGSYKCANVSATDEIPT